jgi:hypothetical protein
MGAARQCCSGGPELSGEVDYLAAVEARETVAKAVLARAFVHMGGGSPGSPSLGSGVDALAVGRQGLHPEPPMPLNFEFLKIRAVAISRREIAVCISMRVNCGQSITLHQSREPNL